MEYEEDRNTFVYVFLTIFLVLVSVSGYFIYAEYKDSQEKNKIEKQNRYERINDLNNNLRSISEKFGLKNLSVNFDGKNLISQRLTHAYNEPCDWNAIYNLAEQLSKDGQRRNAAILYEYYDRSCGKANTATWYAANIYEQIGDHHAALRAIGRYIEDTAENPGGYYLRARSNEVLGNMDQAISDYLTTVSLINDPSKTSYGVFKRLSLAYEAEGEYCEAASAVQTWVAANGEHDNSQLNFLVGELKKKGNCTTDYATGRDTFRHQPDASGVIHVDAYVNGVKGRFVVDTGAALVSVSRSFAERAGLKPSKDSEILLGTANGITKGNRVTIDSVRVGKVKAEKVLGVAMQKTDALGSDIDGLLGRSFLARFDITFAKGRWVVSATEGL